MAGVMWHGNSGEFALVANTAKTGLQYKAAASQRGVAKGIKIMGKQAPGATDPPVKARLTRSTGNFGTGGAVTPGKTNPSQAETAQGTWAGAFTQEPTTPTDTGRSWEVPPQIGIIEFWPPQMWEEIPGGQSLQVELTSAIGSTPTMYAELFVEE